MTIFLRISKVEHQRNPSTFRLLILTAFLSLAVSASAQFSIPLSLEERVEHSSLIIEGRILSKESFWDKSHVMIYTRNRVVADKLFKGNLSKDTVDVVTLGGVVQYEAIVASEEATLPVFQSGVFLLMRHRVADRLPEDRVPQPYELYGYAQGFIAYDLMANTATDPFNQYGSISGGLHRQLSALTHESVRQIRPSEIFAQGLLAPSAPTITSFSPSNVHAGAILDPANNVLTINGSGFGPGATNCAILFKNADNGGAGTISIPYNSNYVTSWSPTKIVLRVPYGAGTGTFVVQDASLGQATSPSALNVEYNIMALESASPTPNAYQMKKMNLNGAGGETIYYSTNTANGGADFNASPEKNAFDRAVDTWRNTVGYNITLGGTTAIGAVNSSDGKNVVMWDNTGTGVAPLGAGVLGITFSAFGGCSDGTWFMTSFDMVYRRTGVSSGSAIAFNATNCGPGAAEVDFETVALHELGHSMTLGHIIDGFGASGDPAKVMNYTVNYNKLRRSPDAAALAGGLYAMSPSGLTYSCTGYTQEMVPVATQRPSNDNCPGTFPSTMTTPGTYPINLYYATSDKNNDPSTSQMTCSAAQIGKYNTVMFPIYTGASGTSINLSIANYTTLVDYSACSGMGVRLVIFQVSSCPGTSWPSPITCVDITGNGALAPITGLSPNTNYMLVFDGLLNTKAKFDLSLSGSLLPVTLIGFKGTVVQEKALLQWETTMERENSGFEVEKSINGKDFTGIGFVPGKGTTTARSAYSFTDPSALQSVQHYRLRQVDVDGRSQLSDMVTLRGRDYGNLNLLRVVNPVGESLQLQFSSPPREDLRLTLYDAQGRLVLSRMVSASGSNTITIPVGGVLRSKGLYVMHLRSREHDEVRKLVTE